MRDREDLSTKFVLVLERQGPLSEGGGPQVVMADSRDVPSRSAERNKPMVMERRDSRADWVTEQRRGATWRLQSKWNRFTCPSILCPPIVCSAPRKAGYSCSSPSILMRRMEC